MSSGADAFGVLFVCHANRCRSPLAHARLVQLAAHRGVSHRIDVESAGTWAADGILPDKGSVAVAREHGLDLSAAGSSRGIQPSDFQRFGHIVVMDRANLADVERLLRLSTGRGGQGAQPVVRLLRSIGQPGARGRRLDVPDPAGRGVAEFRRVFALIDRGCQALLDGLFGADPR